MTLASSRVAAEVRRRFHTTIGKRFSRFVGVALASLAASQLALLLLVSAAHLTAGLAGVVAAAFGAAVSYVLSRWAWERKGRPHLLKETLPFWVVSAGAWLVLGVASHFSSVVATSMGLDHWERQAVINVGYLLANCCTFVTRFLIFHYVLFADRGSKAAPSELVTPSIAVAELSVEAVEGRLRPPAEEIAPAPFVANGSGTRVNGSPAWAADAAPRSLGRRAAPGEAAFPERGARR